MKKVLIISYFYPPLGGPGALRILGFTKYLPKNGWKPYVISVKNPDRYFDIKGKEKIPEDVKVYYTKNIFPLGWAEAGMRKYFKLKNFYSIPDIYIGWIIPTILKAKKIIEKEDIDLIFTSSPSWTSSLIGVLLKKLTKKPLVIEFRDAWSFNPHIVYTMKICKYINIYLESFVLKNLNRLIAVTSGMLNHYVEKYPDLKDKISLIYNGYDLDDFEFKETKSFRKFTIIYTGNFYGIQSPEQFFIALRKVINEEIILKNEMQVLLVGHKKRFVDKLIEKYDLKDIVNIIGFVPSKEANKYILKSQMLLFVIRDNKQAKTYVLSSKVFPYLASGNPILALIPEGEAAQMIRKYSDNSYIITDYDNTQKIAEAIYDCYTKWKEGKLNKEISKKTIEFRKKFNREVETKQLAEIFDKVMGG